MRRAKPAKFPGYKQFLLRGDRASLAALCVLACLSSAHADPQALVGTAVARMGTLAPTITAFGTLAADPNAQTTLAIAHDGTVKSVTVRPGKLVTKGDPIATVETSPSAVAQFEQSKSALEFARKDLDHTRSLFAEQLATRSTLAAAEKAYSDAQSVYAQQKLLGADQAVETMRAPAAGIVTSVAVSPGDRVAANANIASIATRDRLVLNLGLEPTDARAVLPGASVWVTSVQDPTLGFRASIASVDAMLDTQSRLVNAVVAIPVAEGRHLILGMGLEARIALPGERGLVIPKSALMTDEEGTFVFVVQNGHAVRHNVSVQLETSHGALIGAGLTANAAVIATGNAGLENGMAVRVH